MAADPRYRVGEDLFLVHPSYVAGSITDAELTIRAKVVRTILETYTAINNNHTPKPEGSPTQAHLTRVPGWLYTPVYPSTMRTRYPGITIHDKMNKLSTLETPEFNKPLKAALAALQVRSGWQTECTSALQFVQYAVFDSVFPEDITNESLTTEYLDETIPKNRELLSGITGYNTLNIPIIRERVAAGLFTDEVGDQMILDTQKAQRMYMLYMIITSLVFPTPPPANNNNYKKLFPGDILYIHGHPGYTAKFPNGSYRGENVFFVGYSGEGEKLYMGFGDNFMSAAHTANPRKLKDIQIWLALSYAINALTYPAELAGQYAAEAATIIGTKVLPADPSDFAKALFTIRTGEPPTIPNKLNISNILKYTPAEGGNRKKQKRTRRSKLKKRKQSRRSR